MTRLISVIFYKWTSIKEDSNNVYDFPPGLKELRRWLKHLRRADKSPPYVMYVLDFHFSMIFLRADINVFFSNFTTNGKLVLTNYTRYNNKLLMIRVVHLGRVIVKFKQSSMILFLSQRTLSVENYFVVERFYRFSCYMDKF